MPRHTNNAFAYLNINSDEPGGTVAVHVARVGPGFACNEVGEPNDVTVLTYGVADLRFHAGNFVGRDFAVRAKPTAVRVDLNSFAEVIPAGHRVAAVVSGGAGVIGGEPVSTYAPQVTVRGDVGRRSTHVVLPVVEGTLGGQVPSINYPRRPFTPKLR